MVTWKLSETEDYGPLLELFIRNDLEYSEGEGPPNALKMWKIIVEDRVGEQMPEPTSSPSDLVGGIVLSLRDGEYCIDGIAVDPPYRKLKLGRMLLDKAIEEARARGGKRICLVARAPEFFKRAGFVTIPREEATINVDCFQCSQYGTKCFPEMMILVL